MQLDPCLDQNVGRRRLFWTTRPEACGSYELCGIVCEIPGLEYEDVTDPVTHEDVGRTIKTEEWLRSLILNILNTRARTDMRCPTPAAVYGHWSESYRGDGLYIGSMLWNAAAKSYVRTNDAVKAIGVAVRGDMGKLIALEIAQSVDVEATYRGSNAVAIVVTVHTTTGRNRIDLSGSFVSGTWVWHS